VSEPVRLQPVDAAVVTILVDNTVDVLLPSTQIAQRAPRAWDAFERNSLIAEHGYSLLLTVHHNGRTESLLYDAGLGCHTLTHNLDALGIRPDEFDTVVLSHGHADHYGGLVNLRHRAGPQPMRLVLHPDAWRDRKAIFPTGDELHLPPLNHDQLDRAGITLVEERGPSLLLDGMVLVTGQVERATDFERGHSAHQAYLNGQWEPDPWIGDDQAIVCHVKSKGLVVLSGCSHSGVINILRYARRLTGIEPVYAFVGGLHLSGNVFEPIIPRTIKELATINPQVIVPGHCTGWKATHEIARRMPEAYVQSSVGTRLRLV
jgi:7,8-dihydropterin-6-yl-methyl-4-(beta-D-ribofuranosyl)aminobenzene 5'-phosphate synthase